MKRTTVDLDDDVYRELKIRAAERGITMKELVETALRKALAADNDPRPRQRVKFPIIEATDPHYQVTSEDVRRILNEQDEEEAIEQARLGGH